MCEEEFWQIVAQGLERSDFEWLEPLGASMSSLIVLGCWDDGDANRKCREAYALLRILEATRALVVDREAEYIRNARSWFRETRARHPDLFGACDLRFVVADMAIEPHGLPVDCFDLAYCSGVLYSMRSDAGALQATVNTMARVVKPGGWVIACEDEGLDWQFQEAGLEEAERPEDAPAYAYCYRKPLYIGTR
jgi:SAM-dependent methyltransferase